MVDYMSARKFFQEDKGVIALEYVIFVAAIGTVLIVGVGLLFNALGTFFSSWATYFGG